MARTFEEEWELRRRVQEAEKKWWERYLNADELLRYLEVPEPEDHARTPEPAQPLVARLRALGREIEHIKQEIETRLQVLERHKRQINYQIDKAVGSLERLQGGLGYNSGVDSKRSLLESQLLALRSDLRAQVDRAWHDLVELRRALRELIRKYEALKRILTEVGNGNRS